jgi:hypothetical protein
MKPKNEDFGNNQTLYLEKFDTLKNIDFGEFRLLRSDLQFWVSFGDEEKKKKYENYLLRNCPFRLEEDWNK